MTPSRHVSLLSLLCTQNYKHNVHYARVYHYNKCRDLHYTTEIRLPSEVRSVADSDIFLLSYIKLIGGGDVQ